MYCVLCLMSRLSIQEIKALDTSMVQMLCYVEAVDTHVSVHNFLNIQWIFNPKKVLECWEPGLSNHTTKSYICQSSRSMSKQSILDTSMVQMLCYVEAVDTHVSAHNFLNIQWIFNPKKVLECWEPGLSNHITKSYICRSSRSMSKQSILDTSMVQMLCYVEAVDTHVSAHNFLNIQWIFNLKKVLECWEPGLSNHTTKSYICRSSRSMSKQSIHCVQNKLHSMVRMSKQSINCMQNKNYIQ